MVRREEETEPLPCHFVFIALRHLDESRAAGEIFKATDKGAPQPRFRSGCIRNIARVAPVFTGRACHAQYVSRPFRRAKHKNVTQ